ncbi:MBL fold metallo-hydrolase [Terrabacter sp. 2RAF25]|uniref:MBL fold metallo-hydrolase n=1 Tax=Terrabacter sp. 2RAF25 TaxID=3232998 RepID=UPI003F9D1E72
MTDRTDDTYSGHVEPGGAPAVRELSGLTVRKQSVGTMDNNAYLLTCRATGAQLLIDAAAEPSRLLELVAAGGGGLDTVVTTHRHHDHVGALAEVVEATGARTVAGADDADALPVPVDVRVGQGDTVTVGDVTLEVVHLRGHTPGSIALAYADPEGHTHLFTGDSLFPGGAGRTTNRDDFTSLMNDLDSRIFAHYDDDTWFYPGHGDDSTLGAERSHLGEWRARGW